MNAPQNYTLEIARLHAGIIQAAKRSVQDAIRIGEIISSEKEKMNHGQFLPWLEKLPFDDNTAYRYMKLYAYANKIPPVGNLQEAYRQIEFIEGREKQKEKQRQESMIRERERTGKKPEGWDRATDYEFKKKKEEEEIKQRIARAFEENKKNSIPRSDPEELKRHLDSLSDFFTQQAEAEKATAHLRLSGLPQNSAQGIIFQNIEKYLLTIPEPHQKLEAVHNLIKRLKEVANRLQRESVKEAI